MVPGMNESEFLELTRGLDVRAFWQENERCGEFTTGKPLPKLGGGSRGPATIITSVLSAKDVIFWMEDHPELMRRFMQCTQGLCRYDSAAPQA